MLALALGAALVLPAAGPAEERSAGAAPAALSERVSVTLVLVETTVLDAKGDHVRGLRKEDFTVREDGQDVPIVTFDEMDLSPPSAPRRREPSGVPPAIPAAAEPARPPGGQAAPTALAPPVPSGSAAAPASATKPRFLVLLFDAYNNASPLRLSQARRAARRFVEERWRPGDYLAIYQLSPFLRSVVPFTPDPDPVVRAIDKVRYAGGEPLSEEVLRSAVEQGHLGSRRDVEGRISTNAGIASLRLAEERRQFYQGLESVAEAVAAEPGRKVIVLFSGGLPLLPSRDEMANGGITEEFRRMLTALSRAQATVYSADIGEETMLVDAGVRASYRDTLDQLGLGPDFLDRLGIGVGMARESSTAYTQLLAVLAHESGGRFLGGRDYWRFLSAVDDDTRHFYLLGYAPPELDKTPVDAGGRKRERYHRIEVSVARKGVHVLARSGRFDIGEAGAPQPAGLPTARTQSPESLRQRATPTAGPEPVLFCGPISFAGREGRTLVTVPLWLRSQVPVVRIPGAGPALDVSVEIMAAAAGEGAASRSDTFRTKLSEGRGETGFSDGIRLLEALELPPGRYDLSGRVRVNGLGIEARCAVPLEVKSFDTASLALSDLVLVADDSAPPLLADIFTAKRTPEGDGGGGAAAGTAADDPFLLQNDWRLVPSSAPSFVTSTAVTLFFRLYGATLARQGNRPEKLSLEYGLAPAAGGQEFLPPVRLVYFRLARRAGAFDVVVQLDSSRVPPGSYELRVHAEDGPTGQRVVEGRRLEIMEASKPVDSSN